MTVVAQIALLTYVYVKELEQAELEEDENSLEDLLPFYYVYGCTHLLYAPSKITSNFYHEVVPGFANAEFRLRFRMSHHTYK